MEQVQNSEGIQTLLVKDIKERERLGMFDTHEWVHEHIATLKFCAHVVNSHDGSLDPADIWDYGLTQFEKGVMVGRAILSNHTIISAKVGYNDGLESHHCFYFIGRNEMDIAVKLALYLETTLQEDKAAAGILSPEDAP